MLNLNVHSEERKIPPCSLCYNSLERICVSINISTLRRLTVLDIFLVEIRINTFYLSNKFLQASLNCGYKESHSYVNNTNMYFVSSYCGRGPPPSAKFPFPRVSRSPQRLSQPGSWTNLFPLRQLLLHQSFQSLARWCSLLGISTSVLITANAACWAEWSPENNTLPSFCYIPLEDSKTGADFYQCFNETGLSDFYHSLFALCRTQAEIHWGLSVRRQIQSTENSI